MPKWSPETNHFSYTNDIILFCSGDKTSIIKMMHVIRKYEDASGQLVNKSNSFFYLHENTSLIHSIRIRKLTEIRQGIFPLTYLGFLFIMAERIMHILKTF